MWCRALSGQEASTSAPSAASALFSHHVRSSHRFASAAIGAPNKRRRLSGAPRDRLHPFRAAADANVDVELPEEFASRQTGSEEPVSVLFKQCDTGRLWIWLELYSEPSKVERETLEAVFTSWFTLGRCGGFNSQNLQVFYQGEGELSDFPYEVDKAQEALDSTFHDFGELETRKRWCRTWVNMGTADEFSVDVLVNALLTVSRESIGIRLLQIGGDNPAWPAGRSQQPRRPESMFAGLDLDSLNL